MKISAPAETGEESPVTSFVLLERYNAIRLVQIVHASLSSLSKVIRGTALLDAEVQALAGALLKQEVRRSLVAFKLSPPVEVFKLLKKIMTKLVKQSSDIFIEIDSFVKATGVVFLLKALECLCKRYFCCSPLPQAMWIVEKDS